VLIESAVLQSQVVEESQRLAGEPAKLMMMTLGLEFTNHHQRYDDFVFGKPRTRPGIG
jgi:hypothetical protein